MKVNCKQLVYETNNNQVINNDMSDFLSVGSAYFVYGLRISKISLYVYVYDGEHLVEVPIELFDIIDDRVNNFWIVKLWDNGDITLWPKLFYQDQFLENFSEREPFERKLFFDFKKNMEAT